jgi:spore maturation protein A
MNVIFSVIFLSATLILLIISPQTFLSTLLDGASKSGALCLSLVATYAVWLGLMQVWKDSGVTRGISKLLRPLSKRLFKTDDERALGAINMNLSVNLLGISGAGTPFGIESAKLLDKTENAEYSSAMFFVLNATSLQIIPTSIIGVRVALKSANPLNILVPTVLTSLFSTLLGALLVRIFIPPKRKAEKAGKNRAKLQKQRGYV